MFYQRAFMVATDCSFGSSIIITAFDFLVAAVIVGSPIGFTIAESRGVP